MPHVGLPEPNAAGYRALLFGEKWLFNMNEMVPVLQPEILPVHENSKKISVFSPVCPPLQLNSDLEEQTNLRTPGAAELSEEAAGRICWTQSKTELPNAGA